MKLGRAANTGTALRDVVVERCVNGKCWCKKAETCLLYRCTNCDMPVDRDGRALFDDWCADGIDRGFGACPYCHGPVLKRY